MLFFHVYLIGFDSYLFAFILNISLGEKPHSCTFCPSSFSRKDKLKLHYRRSHGDQAPLLKYLLTTFILCAYLYISMQLMSYRNRKEIIFFGRVVIGIYHYFIADFNPQLNLNQYFLKLARVWRVSVIEIPFQ